MKPLVPNPSSHEMMKHVGFSIGFGNVGIAKNSFWSSSSKGINLIFLIFTDQIRKFVSIIISTSLVEYLSSDLDGVQF